MIGGEARLARKGSSKMKARPDFKPLSNPLFDYNLSHTPRYITMCYVIWLDNILHYTILILSKKLKLK